MSKAWRSASSDWQDRRARLLALALVTMVTAAACKPVRAPEVGRIALESGAAIGSVAAPHGESVVLVLSPEHCVSCDVDLAKWFAPGRDSTVPVSVVLTREPTPDEARTIALLRLPVAGRTAPGTEIDSPCVLRFRDGAPVTHSCEDGR